MMAARMAKKQVEGELQLRPTLALRPLDEARARRELSEIADAAGEAGLSRLAALLAGEGRLQRLL
ncbi:MAG: hypothetical protein EOS77_23545, partial [Mesorhizobium sp.]